MQRNLDCLFEHEELHEQSGEGLLHDPPPYIPASSEHTSIPSYQDIATQPPSQSQSPTQAPLSSASPQHAPPPASTSTAAPSSAPPQYASTQPNHPPLPAYTDADDTLMSVSIPSSHLFGDFSPRSLSSTSTSASPSKPRHRASSLLAKLIPKSPSPSHIMVMTRGGYHRYWARDKHGNYIGVEDESEGPRIWRERRAAIDAAREQGRSASGDASGNRSGSASGGGVAAGLREMDARHRKSDAVERKFSQIGGVLGMTAPAVGVGYNGRF